jgi:hypothetical protein
MCTITTTKTFISEEKGEKAVAKGNLTSSATSKWILAFATKIHRR